MNLFRKQSGNGEKKDVAARAPTAKNGESHNNTLSKQRLWLFRLLAISFPFVVLLLAEIAFRVIPGLNEDRDPLRQHLAGFDFLAHHQRHHRRGVL